MEITRKLNFDNSGYDYLMKENNQILNITYAGNLDLYFRLITMRPVGEENVSFSFDITKEYYEVYLLFDLLYQEMMKGDVFNDNREFSCCHNTRNYKDTEEYKRLVKGNKIEWISDDGPQDVEDRMTIEPQEDAYRLTFYRNDKPLDCGFKSHLGVTVRIRNSGSCYHPFNCIFMRLYQRMQMIDPDYKQMSIEEYMYLEKAKQKQKTINQG